MASDQRKTKVQKLGLRRQNSPSVKRCTLSPGNAVGVDRGIGEGGVFVTTRDGKAEHGIEHVRAGHELGEAELLWRCTECGEMGAIKDGLPDQCTECAVGKESLMYWTED